MAINWFLDIKAGNSHTRSVLLSWRSTGPLPHHTSVITAPLSIFLSQRQRFKLWMHDFSPPLHLSEKCGFKKNLTSSFRLQVNYGRIKKTNQTNRFRNKAILSRLHLRGFQLLIFSPCFFANCAHVPFWNQTFTYHFHLMYQKCSQLKHFVPLQALQKVSFRADPKWWLKKYSSVQQMYLRKNHNQPTEHLPWLRAGLAVKVCFPQVKLCTSKLFKFLKECCRSWDWDQLTLTCLMLLIRAYRYF